MSINIRIDLDRYPLLRKVDKLYLETTIEDIFDTGYNNYVRNLMRNDVNNTYNINNITENKLSQNKGQSGEMIVYEILIEKFRDYIIENTAKIPHSGDIQVTIPKNNNKIIVEVKNYNKTVDQGEIDKLKFDMKFNYINYGILVSLNSGIVGKKRFEFETFYYESNYYYILYVPYAMHKIMPNKKNIIIHNYYEESIINLSIKMEFSLCIMVNLQKSIIKNDNSNFRHYNLDENVNKIISELQKIYDEFILVKQSNVKMEENIKKSLEINSITIRDFENNIKNKINNLLNLRLNKNENKIKFYEKDFQKYKIILHEENNWNILFNNLLIGKIIKYKNNFDVLIKINWKNHLTPIDEKIFNEQFDSYEKAINYTNFILNNF